jgi:protein TonB
MRKIVILTVFILISCIVYAQKEKSDFYFKEAMRYFNEKEYALAYSMLNVANKYYATTETYKQMAIIDIIIGDTCNYCINLRKAKNHEEKGKIIALEDFCSDTIWYKDTLNTYQLYCVEPAVDCESFRYKDYYIQMGDSVINRFYLIDSDYNIDMTTYEYFPDLEKNLDRIVGVHDEKPTYKGGEYKLLQFIGEHLNYPTVALENNWQGTVYISFFVSIKGEVKNIQVMKSANEALDKEAIRVVSLTKEWTPAKYKGNPTNTKYIVPIKFKIE